MTIHYEKRNRIAFITLQGENDLNIGTVGPELDEVLIDYRDDNELWCAVITGAGERAFSAGADLKATAQRGGMGGSIWEYRAPTIMADLEIWKPLIAAVNGYAFGAGCLLVLRCDIRVAAENATFALSEVRFGFPASPGTQRLPRQVPYALAMEMLLTGDRIDAQEAFRIGLVNKVVPLPELMPTATRVAERICQNPPLAVRATKELVVKGLSMTLDQGLAYATLLSHITRQTEDAKEGPRAFAEKRPPQWKGR